MSQIFKKTAAPPSEWVRRWSPTGLVIAQGSGHSGGVHLRDPMVGGFLTQLADDGLAVEVDDGFLLGWDALYAAITDAAYASLPEVLSTPPFTKARPILQSSNSLTDGNFSIVLAGWRDHDGAPQDWELNGPLMAREDCSELMQPKQWELFKAVVAFARRSVSERTDIAHRQAWGSIRKLALQAGAQLDDFLYRSVVLTPEKLEIGLRRSEVVDDDHVVEIEPGFEGAPSDWLDAFDRSKDVRDRYDIVTSEGIVQILVTPKVRTVLQEIKRLPGRRVAGSRAQAFLVNPYATLGDDAVDIIVESQFEKAREDAGLAYERFTPVFERDASEYPLQVGLLIETANTNGPATSHTEWLDNAKLEVFVRTLDTALVRNYQLVAWHGYDLEVQGDPQRHLDALKD